MAGEWRAERFGRLALLVRDTVHPSDAPGLPYIGLEHIGAGTLQLLGTGTAEDALSLKDRFSAGDILFGKLRPYFRKVIRAPFDGICSTDIWVVRPQSGVDPGFLFYLMASDLFLEPVVRASEGTKMPRAKWEYATSLVIPCPPLPEQRAIAHILGTLDDKIELNRRQSDTLEQMARALFQAWFVDFEPVRARMEGRWQRGESLPGLPADLYDLFPDRLVESELGPIPEGWEISTVGKEVKVVGGGTPSTGEPAFWEDGIHFFATPKDLSTLASPVLLGTEKKVTDAGLEKISSGLLPPGTVLMSSRAPVGYLAITYVPVCINQGFIAMLCEKEISNFYAFFWADANMTHIKQRASGTTFAEISKSNFRSMQILVPPKNVIGRFDDFVQPWFDGIALLERESHTLAALRDTLLPKLISGELRVAEAERFLKDRGL